METLVLESVVPRLAIALGLGLLVGLQRERTEGSVAGVRTFALVTLFGSVSGLLALEFGGWIVAAGFLSVAAMVVLGNIGKIKMGQLSLGITTEVAVLLMFAVGVYLMQGSLEIGIALGGVTAVLLHAKARLHGIVRGLGDQDVTAIMRFALLTLVILPVLPDSTFGPLDVLNPRQIWLMVVLIVGISLGGYLAYKLLGDRAGTVLAGILGGTISSTATTASYARLTRRAPDGFALSALVILISSAVVFVRLLVEILVVAPASFMQAAPPLVILLAAFTILSLVAWKGMGGDRAGLPKQENPTELRFPIVFAILYAGILLAVAAAESWGSRGLYLIAAISGLVNLDAITLSSANLTREGRLSPADLWRVVMVASLSNLAFKLVIAGVLGGWRLVRHLLPFFLAGSAIALGLLLAWPDG
jgi:uncharacterized membrane protein (DUF4010 family)